MLIVNKLCDSIVPLAKQASITVTWAPEYGSAFPQGLALLTLPLSLPTPGEIPLGVLQPGSYLVVAHPPSTRGNIQMELIVETFLDPTERVQTLSEGHLSWHYPTPVEIKRNIPHPSVGSGLSAFHRIRFPRSEFLFGPSFPAPRLTVAAIHCSENTGDRGLVAFHAPWANYFRHTFASRNSSAVLDLDVPTTQPNGPPDETLFVDLLLKPHCTYRISLQLSLFQWIGKVSG
ncbi:unnamed protein product [Echinostoma caproni]|uniref:Fibronectin type-III domain-containing protein n=1 Tax=Echinostoma caproni TaxID=27848 RepID=A0A183ADF1_9TREM|nr:unnamed protein product [Echinostoma caproni]